MCRCRKRRLEFYSAVVVILLSNSSSDLHVSLSRSPNLNAEVSHVKVTFHKVRPWQDPSFKAMNEAKSCKMPKEFNALMISWLNTKSQFEILTGQFLHQFLSV